MRILNAYIARSFLVTFGMTLVVFLFVMAVGNIFKVIDFLARGISGLLILKIFSYGMPFSLIFAIPMSVLASSFLVFSRMASDREIVAMRACGISIWKIIQPPILIATVFCLVCIYINCSLAPNSHFARRELLGRLGMETPFKLLDEGRFIRDFPGLTIYIGRQNGHKIKDIIVYQFGKKGLKQTLRAESGILNTNTEGKIRIDLYKVRMDKVDQDFPNDLSRVEHYSADEYPLIIDVTELLNRERVWKKRADLTMDEIIKTLHGSMLFSPSEINDMRGLVQQLSQPTNAVASYVAAVLSPNTRRLMKAYEDADESRSAPLAKALANDLNLLILSPNLYTPDRFPLVTLLDETRKLLSQHPQGNELIRLNRMLLEDSFPTELSKSLLSQLSPDDKQLHRTALLVEASTRLTLSFSCYAFAFLGIALGITIHRKESSIGIALTLVLVFFFYFFIIVADSLVDYPKLQPHLIVWIPFVISEGLGFFLIYRSR